MINPKYYQFLPNGVFKRKGTLAQFLDTRAFATGEPDYGNLPSTINPLKTLLKLLWNRNLVIIPIRQQDCSVPGDRFKLLSLLRLITPPEQLILIYLEVTPTTFTVTLSENDSTKAIVNINLVETITGTSDETVLPFYIDDKRYA